MFAEFVEDLNGGELIRIRATETGKGEARKENKGAAEAKGGLTSESRAPADAARAQRRKRGRSGLTRQTETGSELLSIVDQKIRNKNYTRMVGDHLKKLKPTLATRAQENDVYFQYIKWVYNKKCGEEKILNLAPRDRLLDQVLAQTFGGVPNNCVHLRAAFFTWRQQK